MPDSMDRSTRSALMARIRSKNTKPELIVRAMVYKAGYRYRIHYTQLPGSPDLVFLKARVVVFVDGDFWHGFRFPVWRRRLAPFWNRKIENNRCRDRRNFAKLRRLGWKVIRVWEHEVLNDPQRCLEKIIEALRR